MSPNEMTLVEACKELGYRYHRCLNAVLAGDLVGRQNDSGRWLIDRQSVRQMKAMLAKRRALSDPPKKDYID